MVILIIIIIHFKKHYETKNLPKIPLCLYCVDLPLLGMSLHLSMVFISSKAPLEKTKFSLVCSYQVEIAFVLEMGACVYSRQGDPCALLFCHQRSFFPLQKIGMNTEIHSLTVCRPRDTLEYVCLRGKSPSNPSSEG